MMRRFVVILVVGILATLAPRTASAQAKQGDTELLVGGNLFSVMSSGASITNGQFNFGIGYFVTDRFDVSGDLGLASAVQYFFGEKASKVKPYVGGTVIVQSFKTRDQVSFSPNGTP